MADEAFALSPISARAAQPSEADYEAIREAFMETARGRWFLGEYAKRNRNADTRMVLDAVARIEETLAAQRQPPPADNKLEEALAAIRGAVDQAAETAAGALDAAMLELNLVPIRKGARIIKEISWRWREIGADSRICDLIDSQIGAIEAGCGRISELAPGSALSASFDLIKSKIDEIASSEAAAKEETAEVAAPAAPPATDQGATAPVPEAAVIPAAELIELDRPADTTSAVAPADVSAEAADAQDEAILEMVATEMATPDSPDDDDYLDDPADDVRVTAPPAEPLAAAPAPEPAAPKPAPTPLQSHATRSPLQPSQASSEPAPPAAHEPSLGSTIIAKGIVRRSSTSVSDPLAPIRRMSQAEKIAFFS